MGAGILRDRATFQSEDAATDALGNVTDGTWSDVATVWARLVTERTLERVKAGRLESAVSGTLQVRSSATMKTITAAHRVLIDAVPYQIHSVDEERRGRWIYFAVQRGVAT